MNKILYCPIHLKGDKNEDNFQNQCAYFSRFFNLYVPTVPFFGPKFKDAANYAINKEYTHVIFEPSDIKFYNWEVNPIPRIVENCNFEDVGSWGFSFTTEKGRGSDAKWTTYGSPAGIHKNGRRYINGFVEFSFLVVSIEVLKQMDNYLNDSKWGWGWDVAIGYQCNQMGLKVFMDDKVRMMHPNENKTYSSNDAWKEYNSYKILHPELVEFDNKIEGR